MTWEIILVIVLPLNLMYFIVSVLVIPRIWVF